MKRKRFLGFLVLLGALINPAAMLPDLSSAETPAKDGVYWIVFKHNNSLSTQQIFMMQIDGLGNIIVPPKPVVPVNAIGRQIRGALAIAKAGSDKIVLWINKRPQSSKSGFVHKAVVTNPGLGFLGIHKTGVQTSNVDWLSVTQKPAANILAVVTRSKEEHFLSAFGLTLQSLNGSHWLLSPPICQDFCERLFGGGTVSSDGRFALVASARRLFLQRLDGAGKPLGDAELLNTMALAHNTPYYTGADVTGPLAQSRRFVVFGTEAAGNDQDAARLYLQIVTNLGEKVGDRIVLLGDIHAYANQGSCVAVDPRGRFVLYAVGGTHLGDQALVFQALDATGHPSGQPRAIAYDVSWAIDILKE
jgi:hypothetical protein